ncbi:YozE family protein [Apilactobacillus micheneri]|uniref:UPF0346 protein DY114_03070 n=1 Tax=Apilactobacillus micheneri TaxID=1899430 RepID=A0ABY2YXX2_9LACO|nr:YozE family protein [Apilactobacillus micheneri]TPR25600.1 YozE family protein [Apilactobacillus micheneri]TPR26704.1 YozE family protein [Apilactobacillus micheneri]TPR28491.1 YozE family protein [Apilactobacillus micheneri]TPR29178.1 YozE family protein [Apilactobacillus micheneri]TPR30767.1 YozE family protein [Apilactobacillus micheneri]
MKTFYQFLMTERNSGSNDPVAQFANNAFYDQSFPKQSIYYDEISQYLEENASYLPSMTIFDEAWQLFQDYNN